MLHELTADNFQQEVIDSAVPVLVDFWSPGCVPCQRIAPVIDELAAEACDRGEDVAHAVSPSLPP